MSKPLLLVIAGSNGAGKSTFYEVFLSNLGLPFLNADRLALQTGMGADQAAGVIARIREVLVERRLGFVVETVLSDPVGEKVASFAAAVQAGFDVQMIFIGIVDAEMSVARVATRVSAGGHDVPREKLLARYQRTQANLRLAVAALPRVTIYDNSSFDEPYRLVAEFRDGAIFSRGVGKGAWVARGLGI